MRNRAFAVFVHKPWCVNHPYTVVRERDLLVQRAEVGHVPVERMVVELIFLRRYAQTESRTLQITMKGRCVMRFTRYRGYPVDSAWGGPHLQRKYS